LISSPAERARAAELKMLCKMCRSTFLDDEGSLARWLAVRGWVGLAPQPAVQDSQVPVLDNNGEVIGHQGNTEQYFKLE
jgi:hypothetical protein